MTPADNTEPNGLIFNIQRFSVHDGPGIRTTVFMKGCPLTCQWCANPESQSVTPQLMTRDAKCTGCGACAAVCEMAAITFGASGIREIDWEKCAQCLVCADACIFNALHACGRTMNVPEILTEVLSDAHFYKNSDGGITVSGGEPLLQSEFVAALLKTCRDHDLHTAIDTTGYVSWQKIQDVLPYADLMLWDIKHLDPHEHERTTGVNNQLILENLERAAQHVPVWLRIPLIAGFNDDTAHIESLIALAKRIGSPKISLLPYHEGGRSKSLQIGTSYYFTDAQAPSDEKVTFLRNMIADNGLTVGVGN